MRGQMEIELEMERWLEKGDCYTEKSEWLKATQCYARHHTLRWVLQKED